MHCGCGLRPFASTESLADADTIAEIELSRIASRLLEPSYLPHFNHGGIATVVARAARSNGLVEDGTVSWPRVEAFFGDERHRHLFSRTNLPVSRESSLRLALTGKLVLRHPLHNIVLLNALCGGWRAVEDVFAKLSGRESALDHQPKARKRKPVAQTYRRNWIDAHKERWTPYYTALYREVRKTYPEENHTQLMHRIPFDAGLFIARASLAAAGEDVPLFGMGDKYYESLDGSFCRHIRASAKRLIEEGLQKRVSKRVLLQGHRMDRAWSRIMGQLPRAAQALAECEESIPAYRKRRLKMLLRRSPFLSLHGLTTESIDDLDDKTVAEFLTRVRT